MRKISLLVVMIMLFSVFSVGVCAENELPTIYASTNKTETNTVELLLSISEFSNIAGCSFNIVYDSDKLTYTSHEVGSVISPIMNLVNPNYNANAIRVLWADTNELTVGGEIIKVIFTINDGATGSTEIVLDKLKMMDASSLPVDCACENPTIMISEDVEEDDNTADTGNVEDSLPEEDNNSTNNSENESSSSNSSSGNSSSSNKPSTGTTQSGKNESLKEPINNEIKEPIIEDTEDVIDDIESNENEEDYEVFLLGFNDVNETDWFFKSVRFVKFYHLMSGVSETEFAPNSNLTRGMLVTILYRLSGEPECNEPTFKDVEKNMWYSDGIAWAAENKIVNGVGENKFAPNSNITREQIALIMYNYSKLYGLDTTESKDVEIFKDSGDVSTWAMDAVEWSVGAGILSGKGDGILDPKGNATRAEIATVLMRYTEKYDPN